jgi:phage recombination protein Bet
MNETSWDEAKRKLIRDTICPKGIPDGEFLLFMEQCERSGLDPLIKQAFCVKRRQNLGTKEKPNWVDRYEFQPAEAGMLTRAERFPDYDGISAAEVYSEDPITIDYGQGEVQHAVNPAQRKGTLVGAWAKVKRKGKLPVVVWVDFAAMVQSTPLWGKMPAKMIRKCARVDALRTAYPEAFGGLYVAGERPDDVDTGEDADDVRTPTKEKPALPSPAPRETLEMPLAKEPVPVRERAVEDAQTEQVDEMASEAAGIVKACETVTDPTEFARLVTRGKALPEGSPERKMVSAALKEAYSRLGKAGAA